MTRLQFAHCTNSHWTTELDISYSNDLGPGKVYNEQPLSSLTSYLKE